MTRSEYVRIVAAIADRWRSGHWDERMVEAWWPQFSHHDVAVAVKALQRMQNEGHGPFAPDPGMLLQYIKAATPGGGRYHVGRHASAMRELEASVASKQKAQEAISACRAWIADRNTAQAEIAAQNAAEGP